MPKRTWRSIEGAGAALDAGLVELFTVTFSGTTRDPEVSATSGVSATLVNDWSTQVYDSHPTGSLFSGTRTRGWSNGWSFILDGSLFEDYDILGYFLTNVSFATGNGEEDHLKNVTVDADGGSFELYTWTTSSSLFWIEGPQTNQQSNFSFTVTYYGRASTNEVPEPATVLMLGLGLVGAGLAARRKMRNEK